MRHETFSSPHWLLGWFVKLTIAMVFISWLISETLPSLAAGDPQGISYLFVLFLTGMHALTSTIAPVAFGGVIALFLAHRHR